MTTFLLLLSLFLNILALFAIIVLFLRQNRLMLVEKKQEKIITEMEEVISSYLVQMKEENEDFISRVKKMDIRSNSSFGVPSETTQTPLRKTAKADKSDNSSLQENNLHNRIGKIPASVVANVYKKNGKVSRFGPNNNGDDPFNEESVELPPLEVNMEINNNPLPDTELESSNSKSNFQEQSILSQVLLLKNEGLSEGEIAQRLNKGKTEIELLLKFNQNRQE